MLATSFKYRRRRTLVSLKAAAIGKEITKVPSAPEASKNYGFDGLAKESEGYIIALNHEQKMNADWKWFLNAGMNSNKLQRNIIGASSNFVIINDKGDVSNNLMSTQTVTKNYYAQLGINGNIKTGAVNHDVTLALDKAWHSIEGAKNMYNNGVWAGQCQRQYLQRPAGQQCLVSLNRNRFEQ